MPAIGGRQPIGFTLLDYSGETFPVALLANELTAVSLPGFLTDFAALQSALDAVTLGAMQKTRWGNEEILTNTPPTNKAAQVETQMLVRCVGATTEAPYSFRIGTVDYTKFNYADPPARDQVIISGAGASAETTALIDALEALCKMPNDETEAIVVVGMEVVR